ncbi:MAG: LysM peptidoglycan-binding domain-containing protein [Clostridia bacterium]|nr:LysM peptidoglycan-binding domain-containing protein [Clostridia bacterium]
MKLKIVNKKKFIRSSILLLGIMIIALLGINTTYSKTEIAYQEDYIVKGDTLWSIAEKQVNNNEYYKNKDIREVMYEIKELNQIGNGNLEIGQKILIPSL